LESINWIAKINNQDKIARMVKALGNLLRVSINSKVIFSIKEQIDLLKDYVSIQRIRYEDRLNVDIIGNNDVYDYGIPKLIIQPIVENSIIYGLEVLTGNCNIKIAITKKKDLIKIIVSDNGPGMKKDFVKKLMKGKVEPKGSGIGFKNIFDRLTMIYDKKFSLKVESELQKGTKVIITIPAWNIEYYYQVLNIKDN
jgi:two-component system sensor histidine kinase YesM